MAKAKIAYRGKILKRSLLIEPVTIERAEYPDLLAKKMVMVNYDISSVLFEGTVLPIERPTGTTLWYRIQ